MEVWWWTANFQNMANTIDRIKSHTEEDRVKTSLGECPLLSNFIRRQEDHSHNQGMTENFIKEVLDATMGTAEAIPCVHFHPRPHIAMRKCCIWHEVKLTYNNIMNQVMHSFKRTQMILHISQWFDSMVWKLIPTFPKSLSVWKKSQPYRILTFLCYWVPSLQLWMWTNEWFYS